MESRERYFVRAYEDAAEKGPYGRDQLAQSFEKGLLGGRAEVRGVDDDEWVPLASLFRPPPKAPAFVAPATTHAARFDDGDPYAGTRGASVMVWAGLAAIAVGILLSVASSSTPGGRIFIGLVISGAIAVVRGLARG